MQPGSIPRGIARLAVLALIASLGAAPAVMSQTATLGGGRCFLFWTDKGTRRRPRQVP
jgi:hypothetical protein